MKRLLKYLLLGLIAFALHERAEDSRSHEADTLPADISSLTVEYDDCLSPVQHDFSLPRQTSSVNNVRLQSSRRPDNIQRHNFECVKSGKVINACIRYSLQRQTRIAESSLAEPSLILPRLCRFII